MTTKTATGGKIWTPKTKRNAILLRCLPGLAGITLLTVTILIKMDAQTLFEQVISNPSTLRMTNPW